jgi:UDP-glucose 4-epimerase
LAAEGKSASDDGLVLVTGGAGFIGSHLVHLLLSQGHHVRVLDDFSSGHRENLDGAETTAASHGARFQLMEGDVRDDFRVRDALDGCHAVAHLAAIPSVTRSMQDPAGTNSVTHGGTVNIVRRAVEAGAQRVVLASSCAIYGDAEELPLPETAPPRPLSPYAAAKLASEEVCAHAADAGQLSTVCLRFFNVYGPRQDPGSEYSGVISRFMAAAASGGGVTVFGDGLQTRDFVCVSDVAGALALALTKPLAGHSVVNIGSGTQTSLLEILDHLDDLAARPLERTFAAARAGDIRHSRADTGRAAWVLGWRAATSFSDGLATTWRWYRERAGQTRQGTLA